MRIDNVHRGVTGTRKTRRVGRGTGSGHGKTSGRGHKGQKSRSGWSASPVFQGGAMPLIRRIPKRGFHNRFAGTVAIVNLEDLERCFESGDEVTPEALREKSLAKHRYDELKVLGTGKLTKKLRVAAHRFSKSARSRIEEAGGEVALLPGRAPVKEKRKKQKK